MRRKIKKLKIKKFTDLPLVSIPIIGSFFIFVTSFNLGTTGSPQWVMLAKSLLAGKFFFLQTPIELRDSVFLHGHYYWPFPPFPVLLLAPLVALGAIFNITIYQGYLQILLVFGLFILVYLLARKFFRPNGAIWLAIAFTFASPFLRVAVLPSYAHLPYVVADIALFAALLEYVGKKRLWLIGLFMAFALGSRTAAGLGTIFFLGDILLSNKVEVKVKITNLAKLLLPVAIAALLIAGYNYVRFGNLFETGYSIQILTNQALVKARDYGVFSLVHIPGNLYYFIFNAPIPVLKDGISHVLAFPFIKSDSWGLGIFFISPYLLYLFRLSYKDKVSRLLIATSIIIAIPIFTYYGIGFIQLGFRYSLDFMPFIYFLFMRNYSSQFGAVSLRLKWLIAISAIFDLYLLLTLIMMPTPP